MVRASCAVRSAPAKNQTLSAGKTLTQFFSGLRVCHQKGGNSAMAVKKAKKAAVKKTTKKTTKKK